MDESLPDVNKIQFLKIRTNMEEYDGRRKCHYLWVLLHFSWYEIALHRVNICSNCMRCWWLHGNTIYHSRSCVKHLIHSHESLIFITSFHRVAAAIGISMHCSYVHLVTIQCRSLFDPTIATNRCMNTWRTRVHTVNVIQLIFLCRRSWQQIFDSFFHSNIGSTQRNAFLSPQFFVQTKWWMFRSFSSSFFFLILKWTYLMDCPMLYSIQADDAIAVAPDARWDHPIVVNRNKLHSLRALHITLDVYQIGVSSMVFAPDPNEHAATQRIKYRSTVRNEKIFEMD